MQIVWFIFLDKRRKRNIVGEFARIFETVVGVEIGSNKVHAPDRITRLDLLVDWPEKYFSGQSAERISTLLELVW